MIGDLFEVLGKTAEFMPAVNRNDGHANRMAAIAATRTEALEGNFNKALEVIKLKNDELRKLNSSFVMARSTADGLKDKSKALEDALRAVAPNHPLLQVVGLDDEGKVVNNATTIYWKKFDETLAKLTGGKADPKKWRTFLTKIVKR